MKFALNGALTIATLDGANVEIRDAVGADHFFLFGMTAPEVAELRARYRPSDVLAADPGARTAFKRAVGHLLRTRGADRRRRIRRYIAAESRAPGEAPLT